MRKCVIKGARGGHFPSNTIFLKEVLSIPIPLQCFI